MTPPPPQINGARVIQYAIIRTDLSPTGMTRHLVDGKYMGSVQGLAVGQYPQDERFHLFYCDEDWNVLTEEALRSIDEATGQAGMDGVALVWRPARP